MKLLSTIGVKAIPLRIVFQWSFFCAHHYLIDLNEFAEKKLKPHPDRVFDFINYRSNWDSAIGFSYDHDGRKYYKRGSYRRHFST
jgi:hypothetical protein